MDLTGALFLPWLNAPFSFPCKLSILFYPAADGYAFPFSRGIFPTQGLNPGLPHCRQILYQLIHKGSPGILEWVAYPFSSGYS